MKRSKIIYGSISLVAVLALIYFGVNYFNLWRVAESKQLLSQSQKSTDLKEKYLLAREADLLNSSDETSYNMAKVADTTGKYQESRNALSKIKNLDLLWGWNDSKKPKNIKIVLIYEQLRSNYPQVASSFFRKETINMGLTREGYLALSEDFYSTNEFQKALEFALKAREMDGYNPQAYKQLVKIEQKLGDNIKAKEYSEFLTLITF